MIRIQSTYNKFIQKEAAKGNVKTITPQAALRIDIGISEAFTKASEKAKRKQINSAIAIAKRIFKVFKNYK